MQTVSSRFFSNIHFFDITDCWEWTAYRNKGGYGVTRAFGERLAHRASFAYHFGSLEKEEDVLHICDNPGCVNPIHLFKGDQLINMQDCKSKGRMVSANRLKTHCKNGHEFTFENTYIGKNPSGKSRICRTCHREQVRKSWHKT